MSLLVVGAIIVSGGRALVLRRRDDSVLFPGSWDIPGGHVRVGEAPLEALRREIEEETGWRLRRILSELGEMYWTGDDSQRCREIDYLVEIDGDLAAPQLNPREHVEFAWVAADELDRLIDARMPAQTLLRDVLARGLGAAG